MIKYALFVVKSVFVSNISLFTGKHLPCVKAWIRVMFSASVSVPIQLNWISHLLATCTNNGCSCKLDIVNDNCWRVSFVPIWLFGKLAYRTVGVTSFPARSFVVTKGSGSIWREIAFTCTRRHLIFVVVCCGVSRIVSENLYFSSIFVRWLWIQSSICGLSRGSI